MIAVNLRTPLEISLEIAANAKQKRLSYNLTQSTLAERAGVSLGTIKKFEHTGKISLESLLQVALVLNALDDFLMLFKPQAPATYSTLESFLKMNTERKRGRK